MGVSDSGHGGIATTMAQTRVQVTFPQGVAWRKSPVYDDRITEFAGPSVKAELTGILCQGDVQYCQVKMPDGNKHQYQYVPIRSLDGQEICKIMEAPRPAPAPAPPQPTYRQPTAPPPVPYQQPQQTYQQPTAPPQPTYQQPQQTYQQPPNVPPPVTYVQPQQTQVVYQQPAAPPPVTYVQQQPQVVYQQQPTQVIYQQQPQMMQQTMYQDI